MVQDEYRRAFERAKKDLAQALAASEQFQAQADQAHDESIRLRRAVTALALVCGENVEESMGLTEAVRTVFKSSNALKSLGQIKTEIEALGASLSDLKNPDASVMSVLSRLATGGELQPGTQKVKTATGISEVKVWRPKPPPVDVTDDDIPF